MTLVPFTAPTASALPPVSRMVAARDLVLDHEHWSNPRTTTGLDETSLGELADDLKLRGPQVALEVQQVRLSDGRIINLVLDGQRRTLAANRISPKFLLPVKDRTPEPIDLDWETSDRILTDMLAVGAHREGLSDFELSEVAERMKNRDRHLADIGKAIRRSESWVSRILTARAAATPKLLTDWKKGIVTTEQFKDLARVRDPKEQEKQASAVIEASQSGNKSEARALAKEAANQAKESKVPPVVKGPQLDLIPGDKKSKSTDAASAKPVRKPGPSRLAMEELVSMAAKRPPLADLVKGIVLGVQYALGEIEPDSFGKAWFSYLNRAGGEIAKRHLPSKAKKKSAAAKAPKAKPVRKSVKKSPGKKSKR